MRKRVLGIIMSLAMVLCLLPTTVWAESYPEYIQIRYGETSVLSVTLPTTANYYTYGSTTADGKTASETESDVATLPDSGWTWAVQKVETVDAGTTYNYTMTLKDFNIDNSDRSLSGNNDCIRFQSMNLSVVILGTNTLKTPSSKGTGLISEAGTAGKLLISGTGTLNSSGALGMSTFQGITINSGTINASSTVSWGIGSLGTITINGGNVTSNGASSGIRSFYSDMYPSPIGIIINGGTVTAKAGTGVGNSAFYMNPTMADYAGGYRWNINQDTPVWTRSDVTAFTNEDTPVYVQIKPAILNDSNDYDVPTGTVNTDITPIDVSGGINDGQAPYTFSLENAPSWLSITADGVISGTRPAAAAEATTATVKVVDSSTPADSDTITINIGEIKSAEKPVTPSKPTGTTSTISHSDPNTGDRSILGLWIGISLIGTFGLVAIMFMGRRKHKA